MDTITNNSKKETDFFLQAKSLSLNTFPINKDKDLPQDNLYRSISFIPKNFCPKPKPQKAFISPSPMILSTRPRLLLKKISIASKHNELPISCEECSSDCDSDDECEETSSGGVIHEKNAITNSEGIQKSDIVENINSIRKVLSRIRIQSCINVPKDDIKVYLKTKYCLPKEEKSKRHSVELKNRIEQKGFSILNILELSSKDVQS